MKQLDKRWVITGVIAIIAIAALLYWRFANGDALPEGIVSGNGRIEAVEIDVSAKAPGRIRDIIVDEGDFVKAGQIVAHMDSDSLLAQRAEAEARVQQAFNAIEIAQSQLVQRQSERAATQALVRQREAELNAAGKRFSRSATLAREGATSVQERDDDQTRVESARAAVAAARAQRAALDAATSTARAQITGAKANVEAAQATLQRLDIDIADGNLKASSDGRVQYRIAQPGEIIGAGGRVLNLVNLSDVYMTFFLPETVAGRVGLGTEVRLKLDAAPDFIIPAKVSFVADVAQFTPKTVETESERQKLMFRVKAQINRDLLQKHIRQVKTGLPGMAYIRVDPEVEWPANLAINTPK